MAADLGDFTPEDLLYEFYTRTSAEIADMKRDRRQLEVEIPQATRGILMKRKECAIVQSNITKLKEEFTDLNERNKLLKEIMRLNQSLKPRLASQNPTELGGCATLPDIHRRGAQVLRVYDSQNARGQRQPSLWARDSHSTPSLPSIDKARQRPVPSYAQEPAGLCGQRGTKASHLTNEYKRVKSLTNTIERKRECSQRKKDASLSNLRRRNVPLGRGRSQNAMHWSNNV